MSRYNDFGKDTGEVHHNVLTPFETGPGVERTKRQPPKCRRRGYLNVGNYGPGDLIVSSDDKT